MTMTDPQDAVREILRKAYQIEVDGYTFYSMAADRAQKPAVQELFDKLAHDETEHKAFLRNVMKNYEDKGVAAFQLHPRDPDLRQFTATIFTDRFKKEAEGADFEMGVLSIGMQLESRAISYFSGAAQRAEEREVREFYQFLADWEKQHLDALQALHGAVRQDFWSEGGFEPF
jgi:rubrerythrin